MSTETYKLKQSQYARIYGVTERSIRTYQGEGMPLDEPGSALLQLMDRKTRPPGLNSPEMVRHLYNQEAGIESKPTAHRVEQLEASIWKFWDAHNEIRCFVREHQWPRSEEIQELIGDVSITVQKLRAVAGIPDRPAEPGEEED